MVYISAETRNGAKISYPETAKMTAFSPQTRLGKSDSDRGNLKAQEGPLNNFSERQGLRRF